jgi:hypothetical protein
MPSQGRCLERAKDSIQHTVSSVSSLKVLSLATVKVLGCKQQKQTLINLSQKGSY